ncbi:MAG: hypothetical protein RLT05_29145, partial [Bauldia litoralis]
ESEITVTTIGSSAGVEPAWIIADCRAALTYAWDQGVPRTTPVHSAAPAVLADPSLKAEAIDGHLGSAGMSRVHEATLALAQDIFETVRESRFAPIALTLARVPVSNQAPIYRASTLRSAHFEKNGVVAEINAGTPALNARFASPLATFLGDQPNVRVITAPPSAMPKRLVAAPPVAGFRSRLTHASAESVLYRVLAAVWRRLPLRGPRGDLWILRENELLKEAALWLGLSGYGLHNLRTPQVAVVPLDEAAWGDLEPILRPLIEAHIDPLLTPAACAPLTDWLLNRMSAAAGQFYAYRAGWRDRLGGRKPKAVLSNALSTPSATALYEACREAGVPYFAFQHGMTREICQRVASYRLFMENCGADYSVVFNDESAKLEEDNPFKTGTPLVAGMPQDYYRTSDDGPWRGDAPPIWYVSACLLVGNTSLLNLGAPDHEKVAFEFQILNLLNGLPHRVLYKPYPGGRYIDPDPVSAAVERLDNIEVYRERIDLRYIARAARVIFTTRASGTFSWCYVPGKPVVFVDHPEQGPLREEVLPSFRKAVFTFDAREPDWQVRLTEFLARPISDIEREWASMADARKRFLHDYFDAADGRGAGRKAARLIRTAMRKRASYPQEQT